MALGVHHKIPAPLGAGTRGPQTSGWRFRSVLEEGVFWSADVEYLSDRGESSRWRFDRPSTLLDHCCADRRAAACVLRSDKRPWPFGAAVETHVLSHADGVVSDAVVEPVAVDDVTWEPRRDPIRQRGELADYLDYSLGQYQAALNHGGKDVRLTVSGIGTETTVELAFHLPRLPGTGVVRLDKPFDEIGNTAGLRAMNVSLDEDLAAGVPDRLWIPDSSLVTV